MGAWKSVLRSVFSLLSSEIWGEISMRTKPSGLMDGSTSRIVPTSSATTAVFWMPVSNVATASGTRIV